MTATSFSSASLADVLDVVDVAMRALDRRLPAYVPRDDLASAGKVALVQALLGFDGSIAEARSYCYVRVRGAILDELRRLDPLSRHTRAQVTVVQRARAALERELGRVPTASEVAGKTGQAVAVIEQFDRLAIAARICGSDSDGDDDLGALADDSAACPAVNAEAIDARAFMNAALDQLPSKEARVLRRYYLEDATLDQIAGELGVSRERVRQIRDAAEKKLREDFSVLALWQSILGCR